ncbi:MAG: NYN domain-containing protein [Bacteroidota bacterium]|nr:NYN domain-containing protein [Bacteroidota bacterium]
MRTAVYVDGFNLYYGAVRNTPHRWLDLPLLMQNVLHEHHDIQLVRYFTARVSPSQRDRQKPRRQETYLRALKQHCPTVQVHFGHFLRHKVKMPLATPTRKSTLVDVIKTEEKGSDVNLAAHLVNDAWTDKWDSAVVVSNDSDLAEAMRLVRQRVNIHVGLVTPGSRQVSSQLKSHADFVRRIRGGALARSQLPDPIPNTNIRKPDSW